MYRAASLMASIALLAIFTIVLIAYGTDAPPLGFAPDKLLVQKAIALQVSQTHQQLTQQLQASSPKFEITQVVLKQLEPLYIDNLPTYHFRGTYNLKIQLPQQRVTQQNNPFDVYLQRQQEGKTWRLLLPQYVGKGIRPSWHSYLIR